MQRINPLQVAAGNRHAQHGHSGFGCNHAWQVGSTARARNNGLQPTAGGAFGIGKHIIRHTVGRDYPRLKGYAKLLKNLRSVLHGFPVGAGTHNDTYLNASHV